MTNVEKQDAKRRTAVGGSVRTYSMSLVYMKSLFLPNLITS